MLGATPWAHGHHFHHPTPSPSSGAYHHHHHHHRHPDALHTRKPSLSNSVSSNDSSSTQSTRSSGTVRHTRVLDFDPLSLHPTFQPPPRLGERPFIHNSASIEDDVLNSYFLSQESALAEQQKQQQQQQQQFRTDSFTAAVPERPAPRAVPSRTPMVRHHQQQQQQQEQKQQSLQQQAIGQRSRELAAEGDDYFLYKVQQHIAATRPQLPRSHWSESTIQTVDTTTSAESDNDDDGGDGDGDDENDDDEEVDAAEEQESSVVGEERPVRESRWQNFSYKRSTPPRRPQMKSLDSVEDFIKRGGWKRRGIVFEQQQQQQENTRQAESSLF